jgi:dipeptidyl aminopeptidase/acylaminoacyl peptidase
MYSIPASGGEPTPVAVGAFEVETAALTADGEDLLVVSNQGDIDRRHVWRVPIDGDRPATRLTEGDWIEWAPVQVGDGYAWLRSGATVPAHAVIRPEGAPEAFALAAEAIPAGYPSDRMVRPEAVMLSGADGMPIPAQIFLPNDLEPGERRPAAIFFHGGSRRQMLLGFHYSGYYHNAYSLSQVFASMGYVAMAVNYRSGIGYGMEFREALNYGATGGSEFQDVLGAGLYLRSRNDVDSDRIFLWGGSYGGYLTAMGLSRASHLFAAGVDIHGVHDWNEGIRIFYPAYDPTPEQERLAFESSPNASLDTWRSPVLLIHGDDDRNVFFSQSVWLVEQLRDRDVHVEQLVFPDEVHGFLRHESWIRAYEATVDFFERMRQSVE